MQPRPQPSSRCSHITVTEMGAAHKISSSAALRLHYFRQEAGRQNWRWRCLQSILLPFYISTSAFAMVVEVRKNDEKKRRATQFVCRIAPIRVPNSISPLQIRIVSCLAPFSVEDGKMPLLAPLRHCIDLAARAWLPIFVSFFLSLSLSLFLAICIWLSGWLVSHTKWKRSLSLTENEVAISYVSF